MIARQDAAMVRLDAVEKRYGATPALHPTTLDIGQGEFLSLLGPSGSGKTTLLNIVAGMISPSAGRVEIAGRDVTDLPSSKRGIGMVFQNYALMPHMTVFQNVAFPLEIRRTPRDEVRRRVEGALDLVRLSHLSGRRPRELSGGQQQRISLARCMVYDPPLILMDEPLGALDKALREQMQLEIKRLHTQSGVTIVYVTHDQDEALNMSDRIMLMNAGAVEQVATPSELYESPVSTFAGAFVGQSSLLSGELVAPGTAKLTCGPVVAVRGGGPLGAGKLLLRPEALKLQPAGSDEVGRNSVEGSLAETLVTGGVVKHFVDLDGGEQVVVLALPTSLAAPLARGARVSVAWSRDAGIFLQR